VSFPSALANLVKPLRTPEPGHSLGVYASAAAGVTVKEDSSDASISNGKHAWRENASQGWNLAIQGWVGRHLSNQS
jgi:hypothetical protein